MKWILTQDKYAVVNLDMTTGIHVNMVDKDYYVLESSSCGAGYNLGTYHSKEQLKRVLHDICIDGIQEMPPCACEKCRGERDE